MEHTSTATKGAVRASSNNNKVLSAASPFNATTTITTTTTDSQQRHTTPTPTPLLDSLTTERSEEATTWPLPPLAADTGFGSQAHSQQALSPSSAAWGERRWSDSDRGTRDLLYSDSGGQPIATSWLDSDSEARGLPHGDSEARGLPHRGSEARGLLHSDGGRSTQSASTVSGSEPFTAENVVPQEVSPPSLQPDSTNSTSLTPPATSLTPTATSLTPTAYSVTPTARQGALFSEDNSFPSDRTASLVGSSLSSQLAPTTASVRADGGHRSVRASVDSSAAGVSPVDGSAATTFSRVDGSRDTRLSQVETSVATILPRVQGRSDFTSLRVQGASEFLFSRRETRVWPLVDTPSPAQSSAGVSADPVVSEARAQDVSSLTAQGTEPSVSTTQGVSSSATRVPSSRTTTSANISPRFQSAGPVIRGVRGLSPQSHSPVSLAETESFATGRRVAEIATFTSGDIWLLTSQGEGATATSASSSSSPSPSVEPLPSAAGEGLLSERGISGSYRDDVVTSDRSFLSPLTSYPTPLSAAHIPAPVSQRWWSTSPTSLSPLAPTPALGAVQLHSNSSLLSASVTLTPTPTLIEAATLPSSKVITTLTPTEGISTLTSSKVIATPTRPFLSNLPTLTALSPLGPFHTAPVPPSDSAQPHGPRSTVSAVNTDTHTLATLTHSSVAVSLIDVHATVSAADGGVVVVSTPVGDPSVTVSERSEVHDMASPLADTAPLVNRTATAHLPPPPSPSSPYPTPSDETPVSSRVATVADSTHTSLTTSLGASSVQGGQEASSSVQPSAALSEADHGVTTTAGDSGALGVTETDRVTDSSGDVSGEGEVTDTAATTVVVVPTVIRPTPSSTVWCSKSVAPSSAPGNGSALSTDHGGEGVSTLAIVLPVCVVLLVLIGVIIIMSLLCFRRKKKKKARRKADQDDLWVEPVTHHVTPLSLIDTTTSRPAPSSTCTTVQSKTETEDEDNPLYLVVHEFLSQHATQVTLTPGDILRVKEMADNGWWRGGVHGNDKTGWFPSSFVVPYTQEAVQALSPGWKAGTGEQETPKARVSSFLIRKTQANRSLREHSTFTLHDMRSQNGSGSSAVVRSASTLTPTSHSTLHPVSPGRLLAPSASLTAEDFSASVRDKYFKALFSYKAAFRGELSLKVGEVVEGRERDHNGWMLGRKVRGGEEGWFPAVYVDQVEGQLSLLEEKRDATDRMTSSLDHDVYGLLAVNRNKSPDQSWIAIEHCGIKTYQGDGDTHLPIKVGEVVSVVEALDTGWWLGCHGDQVGWFPGSYVVLLEEKSEGGSELDPAHLFPLHHTASLSLHTEDSASKRSSLVSSVDTADLSDRRQPHSLSSESVLSSEDSKPRPARTAPKPPSHPVHNKHLNGKVTGGGTLSRNPRPMRPAPAPPIVKSRAESVGSVNTVASGEGPGSVGRGVSPSRESSLASLTPRKQRKPRVVRIPKERVGLDKISSCPAPSSRPPSLSTATSSVTLTGVSSLPLSSLAERGGAKSLTDASSEQEAHSISTLSDLSSDLETSGWGPPTDQKDSSNHVLNAITHQCPSLTGSEEVSDKNSGDDTTQKSLDIERSQDVSATSDVRPHDVCSVDSQPVCQEPDSDLLTQSDLLTEVKQLVPGLRYVEDTDDRGQSETDTRLSQDASPAPVNSSPTLTVPAASVSHNGLQHGQADTACPHAAQDSDSKFAAKASTTTMEVSQDAAGTAHSSESQSPDTTSTDSVTHSLHSFPNPLMATHPSPSPSSIPAPRYVPPPPELLEEAEESSVDEVSTQPAPEHSVLAAAQPRSSGGYWRFSGQESGGQGVRHKPVKVTKVGPPVLPRTGSGREGRGDIQVPPPDTSGRVSHIVHQINRRTSLEERPPTPSSRKPSLQHDSPADLLSPRDASNRSTPSPQLTRNSPVSGNSDRDTPPHPTLTTQDTLVNGGPAFHVAAATSSDQTLQQTSHTVESVPPSDCVEDLPRTHRSLAGHSHQSRESTPESESERGGQPKSGKKSRAPLPPLKSSPEPSSRKHKKMTMVDREASEC